MTLRAISLRIIRHNDSQSILTLWTETEGRVTVSLPAGTGRTAMRLRALTQPLSLVEAEIDLRQNRQIHTVRELRPLYTAMSLSASPVKNITALFLADFLDTCLRHNEADPLMSRFIFDSVISLDSMAADAASNFIIYFTLHFARFLGIEPDWPEVGAIFDMQEGRFRQSIPLHTNYLSEQETTTLRQLRRMTVRSMHLYHFSRAERSAILHRILAYYSIHHRPVTALPSLTILSAL